MREFARRGEHKHARAANVFTREARERGQAKRQRFAGAGLRDGDKIQTLQRDRDGLRLDRGRDADLACLQYLQAARINVQIVKRHNGLPKWVGAVHDKAHGTREAFSARTKVGSNARRRETQTLA